MYFFTKCVQEEADLHKKKGVESSKAVNEAFDKLDKLYNNGRTAENFYPAEPAAKAPAAEPADETAAAKAPAAEPAGAQSGPHWPSKCQLFLSDFVRSGEAATSVLFDEYKVPPAYE